MKVNDIVRIKKTNKLGRVKKLDGHSQNIHCGIVVKPYVYNEEDLELVELDKLSHFELVEIIEELL